MTHLLFTGFPGFLASALVPRRLAFDPEASVTCLVEPKFAELAKRKRSALVEADRGLHGRIELVEGDITRSGLGIGSGGGAGGATTGLRERTTEIFHLAAVYDIEVSRDLATRVNVEGTRNVMDFAAECSDLGRVHYVSTCYVSGRYDGTFSESDLDVGQVFNNFYEETKFLAEVEVQERMAGGTPATVYRPSIVVGDSDTGATQKYDGPYFFIRWILKQPRVGILPLAGDPESTLANIVPRDFVIRAMAYLSELPGSEGAVYHLADPDPLTLDEITRLVGKVAGVRLFRPRLPAGVIKAALRRVPGLRRLAGIPPGAIDYYTHPTRYSVEATLAELEPAGIGVPDVRDYMPKLVDYVRRHPEVEVRRRTAGRG